MIKSTVYYADLFKKYLSDDYLISIDVSQNNIKHNYNSFQEFYNKENNCILFCAAKHREGSDIPNLDSCIFLDYVEKRNSKTFVQCIGRVLRKDKENKKEFGLIIDVKAKSINNLIDRMSDYFGLEDSNICPFHYDYYKLDNNFIHKLYLIKNPKKHNYIDVEQEKYDKSVSKEELINYFKREIPIERVYNQRLNKELDLIISKNLGKYLLQACQILKMTNNIPHITRGSCGSSLVCYLLGISNIDPIKHKISFARFLNIYRNNLPDIDFDFPHYYRDEIFLKLYLQWNNKIARISNHVYFQEKSALRQSLRLNGYRHFISNQELYSFIKSLPKSTQDSIKNTQKKLQNSFRGYMSLWWNSIF